MDIIVQLSGDQVKGIKKYLEIEYDIIEPTKGDITTFINQCIFDDIHFGGVGECVNEFEN